MADTLDSQGLLWHGTLTAKQGHGSGGGGRLIPTAVWTPEEAPHTDHRPAPDRKQEWRVEVVPGQRPMPAGAQWDPLPGLASPSSW